MFEKKVEEFLIMIIMVIKGLIKDILVVFLSVMIVCVICLVMKKFIVEEKEVLFIVEIKLIMIYSKCGYEFGGLFGVFFLMIVLLVIVVLFYLFCNEIELCIFC